MPHYEIEDGKKVLKHRTLSVAEAQEKSNAEAKEEQQRQTLLDELTDYLVNSEDTAKPKISNIRLLSQFSSIDRSILDDAWKAAQTIKKESN